MTIYTLNDFCFITEIPDDYSLQCPDNSYDKEHKVKLIFMHSATFQ